MRFAREDGVAVQPLLLCPFHFTVPICALDQAYRNAPTNIAGKIDQETHAVATSPLVGLQRHAKTVPATQRRIAINSFKDV